MNKRQREKFIKELRYAYDNNIVPQEHLITLIKIVSVSLLPSTCKSNGIYHECLAAVGMPYKDDLLKGWEDLVEQAAKHKSTDLICLA